MKLQFVSLYKRKALRAYVTCNLQTILIPLMLLIYYLKEKLRVLIFNRKSSNRKYEQCHTNQ